LAKKIIMMEDRIHRDEKLREDNNSKMLFYDQTQKEMVMYLKNF